MEDKAKVWIARDKDGSLWVHPNIPFRDDDMWFCDAPIMGVDSSCFPNIKWEDDKPTEAYISLAEPQPTPKKEIDWEQRRYEIVKDISAAIYSRPTVKTALLNVIISAADAIIKELKKQSDND